MVVSKDIHMLMWERLSKEFVMSASLWLRVRVLIGVLAVSLSTQLAAATRVETLAVSEGYVRHLGNLINDYRAGHGLQPLIPAENLVALADEHSAGMAAQRKLSHDGFRDRAQRTQSAVCVENVGWNYPSPETQLEGWRKSPTHDRNLLHPKVSRMGLAVNTRYVAFFACT